MTGYDVIDLFKRELAAFPFRAGMISTDEFKKELLGSLYGTLNGYPESMDFSARCDQVLEGAFENFVNQMHGKYNIYGDSLVWFNSLCDGIR
ncbi:MAG: hypothetical protein AAB408_00960 [Patescibacteria group bacterium]